MLVYKVGNNATNDDSNWSSPYTFRTLPAGTNWPVTCVMLGDLGADDGFSIPHLEEEAKAGIYHVIFHNGDFAYDFDKENGRLGDRFMRLMQETIARVPYMTAVGNHESAYNFSHYKNRFNMPDNNDNMFYSINIGPIHWIAYVSDYYYFLQFGTEQIYRQYAWLEKDLMEANKPENRAKHPWIVAFSHRPMYCSNDDTEHCRNPNNRIREGIKITDGKSKYFILGLEDLFYRESVDIVFGAHEHSYERCFPVYKQKKCPTRDKDPYYNPTGPIHIVAGAAGNNEGQTGFVKNPPAYSAFRSDDYGYTRIVAVNGSYMYMEEISVKSAEGLHETPKVIDKFQIWKTTDRPNFTCHQATGFSEPPAFSLWDWLHFPAGADL
ncbi:unnamed protein product [Hymenolepis diminuta]|uniref:Acid phosphatase n=2 Tax=Hymenolepis diminuta TaxID=6216 RepID=A0A3P6W3U3_HYMDI|nr:unnamed protein product [Hymenolepis diminuta]